MLYKMYVAIHVDAKVLTLKRTERDKLEISYQLSFESATHFI